MRRSPAMTVMIRAAEKAGRAVIRDFGEVEQLQASQRGPKDFVAKAEAKSDEVIREMLQQARPRFGLMQATTGEVTGEDTSHRFIVAPINGRANFMHGLPNFAVSIALEESREVIAGVIYNPITDEMFWGERNGGAYVHDRRLRVSKRNSLADCLLAGGGPAPASDANAAPQSGDWLGITGRIAGSGAGVRMQGAAALNLAHVAAGRLDGYIAAGPHGWDVAAGVIIVREAGGQVTDFSGGPRWMDKREIVAGPPELHRQLTKLATG